MVNRLLASLVQTYRRRRLGITEPTVRVGRGVSFASSDTVTILSNSKLGDYVRVRGNVCIGESSHIRAFTNLDARGGSISIGNFCSLNDYCVIYGMGGVVVGNQVLIATHTIFVSSNHSYQNSKIPIRLQQIVLREIVVEDDVWIGANCTILAGVTIGSGSVIGAGSVVNKDIPPYSVAVGVPAKIIKKRA